MVEMSLDSVDATCAQLVPFLSKLSWSLWRVLLLGGTAFSKGSVLVKLYSNYPVRCMRSEGSSDCSCTRIQL